MAVRPILAIPSLYIILSLNSFEFPRKLIIIQKLLPPDQMSSPLNEMQFHKTFMYLPDRIGKWMKALADEYFKDTALKSYQVPFILVISECEGITQKDLKETIPFDKSRISVIVNELIEIGFVEDRGVGRQTALYLTDEGKMTLVICRMFQDLAKHKLLACFDEKELDTLGTLLCKFNTHIERLNEDIQ